MENKTLYQIAKYWKRQYYFVYWIWIFNVIVILGLVMNFVAVTENSCKMPFNTVTVNYYWLTDLFYLKGYFYSIGDIFMTIGLLGIFVLLLVPYLIDRSYDNKFQKIATN